MGKQPGLCVDVVRIALKVAIYHLNLPSVGANSTKLHRLITQLMSVLNSSPYLCLRAGLLKASSDTVASTASE